MKTRASFWMMSAAVLALSACAGNGKGPGAIGTKNDIAVINHGLPGAPSATDVAGDASSADLLNTPETLEPNPAPAVADGEPLSDPSSISSPLAEDQPLAESGPAFETGAEQGDHAQAPVPSVPMNDATTATTAPVTDAARVAGALPPSAPVPTQAVPVSEPAAQAAAPSPEPVLVPVAQAPSVPVQPVEAPVQPSAMAAAVPAPSSVYPASDYSAPSIAPAASPSPSPSIRAPLNFYDPVIITAAQNALKAKIGYKGKNDGVISTEFLNSLSEYQALNKLPQGGLNEPTLRSLGVIE